MSQQYTVGVDFGTESGRAVVIRVSDGFEMGAAVSAYGDGVIDRTLPSTGAVLEPEWALQNPDNYLDVFRHAVPAAVRSSGVSIDDIVGIGVDFTSCTMLPTLADGTPLCEVPELRGNPHAWVKLWKHHAAQPEADHINETARLRSEPWLKRYGGKISSEWFFSKALQILHEAPEIYAATERFIEATDWVVWRLCGVETRNACTAGYKAMYQDGSFPSPDYFAALHPAFGDVIQTRMSPTLVALGDMAGELTAEAAGWTGLRQGIAVAVANVDAHVTAPAAGVVEAGRMVAIMGTSTCHVLNADKLADVPGMCGVVDGGIIPGMYGYEAGQSGVGDIFAWFVNNAVPPSFHTEAQDRQLSVHELLEAKSAVQRPGAHGLVALDWWNGNRSVLVSADLSGLLVGATLATTAPDIYRALIESTAFGTRVIIENFQNHGIPVTELVIAGGLAKNKMLMQIYADVTGLPLTVVGSTQGPALGSAIHAAVAAGVYPDIRAAAARMGRADRGVYQPSAADQRAYDPIYADYVELHDYFGRGANNVMSRLKSRAHHLAGKA